jgi:hypothetical protein
MCVPETFGNEVVSINGSLKTGFGLGIEHHIKWPIDDDFFRAGKQAVQPARRRDAAYPQTHAEALIRLATPVGRT